MKNFKLLKKTLLLFLLLTQFNCNGQGKYKFPWERFNKTLSLDFGGGTAHYFGDIHPTNNFYSYTSTVRWNVSSNLIWQLSPYFSVRAGFAWVRISGDDFTFTSKNMEAKPQSDIYDLQFLRNLHFKNDLKEISLTGQINLSNGFSNRTSNRPNQTPYIFSGINAFINQPFARDKFDVIANKKGDWTALNVSQKVSKFGVSVPIGIGIRKKLNPKFDLIAEICYRITFTDALDDIVQSPYSATVGNFENRTTELIAARAEQSRASNFNVVSNRQGFPTYGGTANKLPPTIGYPNPFPERGEAGNDSYWTTSLRIRYYFSKKIKCI
jgi:hypothetical protein